MGARDMCCNGFAERTFLDPRAAGRRAGPVRTCKSESCAHAITTLETKDVDLGHRMARKRLVHPISESGP